MEYDNRAARARPTRAGLYVNRARERHSLPQIDMIITRQRSTNHDHAE